MRVRGSVRAIRHRNRDLLSSINGSGRAVGVARSTGGCDSPEDAALRLEVEAAACLVIGRSAVRSALA